MGKVRFAEAAKAVLQDYKLKGHSTYDAVEGRIRNHLRPFFAGRRMSTITAADVRRYKAERQAPTVDDDGTKKEGAANSTTNRELAILRRAFKLVVKDRKLHEDQAPDIDILPEDNVREGFFREDEFEDVCDELPEELQGPVTFAYYTGWRIASEVFPLRWTQVDRQEQTIVLESGTTKNDEPRIAPYGASPELADVIDRAWAEHKRLQGQGTICPYVFHRNGKPIKDMRGAWKSACEAAGCPGKLPHDLRRTAARNLVRKGVPEKVVMKITGHETRSVFERYNIVDDSDLRDALGKLADEAEESATGTIQGQSGGQAPAAQFPESS